jgi:hypothetical protein
MIEWKSVGKCSWGAMPHPQIVMSVGRHSSRTKQWTAFVAVYVPGNMPAHRESYVFYGQFDDPETAKQKCDAALMDFAASIGSLCSHLLEPIP